MPSKFQKNALGMTLRCTTHRSVEYLLGEEIPETATIHSNYAADYATDSGLDYAVNRFTQAASDDL